MSSAIERNRTHRKEKKSIEPNPTFDFRTRDLCKTDVEDPLPDLRSSSYFSPECSARPGGYSHTLPTRVCAAHRGRDFEAPDLERGIHFRGVF